MSKPIIVGALVILGLAACTTPHREPIALSPQVAAAFEVYKDYSNPLAFAVSTDGTRSGAVICPEGDCRGNEQYDAIRACERFGKPCVIYALGTRVIVPTAPTREPRQTPASGVRGNYST